MKVFGNWVLEVKSNLNLTLRFIKLYEMKIKKKWKNERKKDGNLKEKKEIGGTGLWGGHEKDENRKILKTKIHV